MENVAFYMQKVYCINGKIIQYPRPYNALEIVRHYQRLADRMEGENIIFDNPSDDVYKSEFIPVY